MKEEPINQGQHRISQVYLKQFAFEKNSELQLSVFKVGAEFTEYVLVSQFTKEINFFDVPIDDNDVKRYFENLSNIVENEYPRVLSNIENQKQIIAKDQDILNHYIANLLCRTYRFRRRIEHILTTKKTRDKFAREISMFAKDIENIDSLLGNYFDIKYFNLIIGPLMNHLVSVFRCFNHAVIKSPDSRGWLTTDNPVSIVSDSFDVIIPIDSEILFPLSPRYCLYTSHPSNWNKSRLFQTPFKKNKINEITEEEFVKSTGVISINLHEYLISNTDLGKAKIG